MYTMGRAAEDQVQLDPRHQHALDTVFLDDLRLEQCEAGRYLLALRYKCIEQRAAHAKQSADYRQAMADIEKEHDRW